MSGPSWGPVIPDADGVHWAKPVQGSYRCERTGESAKLTDAGAYPVVAECKTCHGRIRLKWLVQMEWEHVPAPAAGDTP